MANLLLPTPHFSARGWGGLSLQPNFQKEGLYRISQFSEGVAGKEGVDLFRRLRFSIKNKLKSEIFNHKKLYNQKRFSLP